MHFTLSAVLIALLACIGMTSANIVGMSVTSGEPIRAGQDFNVTFSTRNSLTNNQQYYAIFGWTFGRVYDKTIGSEPFANVDITDYAKGGKNFTVTIQAPSDYLDSKASQANLTSAIFSQTGASGGVSILLFRDVVNVAQ